jgi:transcription elongation factor GreA
MSPGDHAHQTDPVPSWARPRREGEEEVAMVQTSDRRAALTQNCGARVDLGARVDRGATVRLKDAAGGTEWEVTIVESHQADPDAARISDECPIGEALIGRRPGDLIEVRVPAGTARYRVLSIEPAPGGTGSPERPAG